MLLVSGLFIRIMILCLLIRWCFIHLHLGLRWVARHAPKPGNGCSSDLSRTSHATLHSPCKTDCNNAQSSWTVITWPYIYHPWRRFCNSELCGNSFCICHDFCSMYSDYLYVNHGGESSAVFHEYVVKSIQEMQSCFVTRSERSCLYDPDLNGSMQVPEWKIVHVTEWDQSPAVPWIVFG